MKIKVYVIDFETPRWLRKLVAYVAPMVVVLGVAAIVFAAPINTNWVASGLPIGATNLKGNLDDLQAQVSASAPPGVVIAYTGVAVPSGWLLCDGSAVNRAGLYSNLYNVIGTRFGIGDNTTTFTLPDFRGRFLRGDNGLATVDPGPRNPVPNGGATSGVGTLEDAAFASHVHSVTDPGHNHSPGAGLWIGTGNCGNPAIGTYTPGGSGPTLYQCDHSAVNLTTITTVNTTGGPETRPLNSAVNYLIKY